MWIRILIDLPVLDPDLYSGSGSRSRGVPRGDAQDARASPPPPLCIPPPGHVHPPPPQPERLVMRKDEAVGNKKKMQVCLPRYT